MTLNMNMEILEQINAKGKVNLLQEQKKKFQATANRRGTSYELKVKCM